MVHVTITWDPEAFVWVAVGRDLPDLVLEDPAPDRLAERVRNVLPALLMREGREPSEDLRFHYDGPHCK